MGYSKQVHYKRPSSELAAIIVANCVPVVGLLYFDMSVVGLLVFYWLEFTTLAVWAIVRALFAGNSPKVDDDHPIFGNGRWNGTGMSIPWTGVEIRYETIPVLVVIIPLLTVLWAGFGGLIVGPVVAMNPAAEVPLWVMIGAITVFITEGGRVATEYFHCGRYREVTAWKAVKGAFWQGLVLVGTGLIIVMIAREFADGRPVDLETTATGPLVVSVVVVKFTTDLLRYYLGTPDRPLQGAI